MWKIFIFALGSLAFAGGIVINPYDSKKIHPSYNGDSMVICSYAGVKTCGTTCYPVKVEVGDDKVAPYFGSFSVWVQEEPVVIKNKANVSIDCEVFRPPCELLESPPAIAPDDLVDGCSDCTGKSNSQFEQVLSVQTGKVLCSATRLSTRTVLTTAECVDNQGDVKISPGSSNNPVIEVIIHPDYDRDTKENNLAILTLEFPKTFSSPPCICSSDSAPSTYKGITLPKFTVGPCGLCQDLTNTDVCTTLYSPHTTVQKKDIGSGLFIKNENGDEVLCGVLAGGTLRNGQKFDKSKGFNVIELTSYYNWINENVMDCTL